jgi:hypothetical protein
MLDKIAFQACLIDRSSISPLLESTTYEPFETDYLCHNCVRCPLKPRANIFITGTARRVSMMAEVVDGECVGACRCALLSAAGKNFQACAIDHPAISPFRINDLREGNDRDDAICVRPPNVSQSLTGASSLAAADRRRDLSSIGRLVASSVRRSAGRSQQRNQTGGGTHA